MERVPRKQKKTDRKKGWVLLCALGLVLLCLGGWLLMKEEPLPEPKAAQITWIASYDADAITGLTVSPRGSTAYPLILTEEGMKIRGQENLPLREDVVEEMLEAAGHLQAQDVIGTPEEVGVPLAAFGLEEPELKVEMTLQDGTTQEILFGDRVPETDLPQYYCLSKGVLYTVLCDPCDVLFHDVEYLRKFKQPEIQTDLIDRIDVTGDVTLSLAYTGDGFCMEAPWDYPANEAKVEMLLQNIGRMAFEAYLGTPEENDLAALGLEEPALCVVITQAASVITGETVDGEQVSLEVPQVKYTLHIGRDSGSSAVYVCWENGVYKASNFLLGFWKEMQPDDYLAPSPINITVEKLKSITVKTDTAEEKYQVEMVESVGQNNEIETDEFGRTLYDAKIMKNGQVTDAAAFLSWYVQLNKLPLSGRVKENWKMEGQPLATIILQGHLEERQVSFYPYDSLHAVMVVDGTGIYYLERSALFLLERLP